MLFSVFYNFRVMLLLSCVAGVFWYFCFRGRRVKKDQLTTATEKSFPVQKVSKSMLMEPRTAKEPVDSKETASNAPLQPSTVLQSGSNEPSKENVDPNQNQHKEENSKKQDSGYLAIQMVK